MPSDAHGPSWGPPLAPPGDPPPDRPFVADPLWSSVLPDPTPTGEIPRMFVDDPDPSEIEPVRFSRRRNRPWRWIFAATVPVGLFILGASFIVIGFGVDLSPERSNSSSGAITELPMATAAITVTGDPAVAAIDTIISFTARLQTRDFAGAAVFTGGIWTPTVLERSYEGFESLQSIVVRLLPVGPDEYRARVVVLSVPADPARAATARCETWTVSPTVPRVVPATEPQSIGTELDRLLRDDALTQTMAATCLSASIG